MRVLQFANRDELYGYGTWDPLTGAFPTLEAAEQWLDHPPPDVAGDPSLDAVAVERNHDGGWLILSLSQRSDPSRATPARA